MLDFYIYGFKSQNDFTRKSSRTYDNERHLIESYLGEYMKWEYTKTGKSLFISMDCARIPVNPLYAAHTLEDGILLDRLYAIRNRQSIEFVNINEAGTKVSTYYGIPVKVYASSATGRRYLCLYKTKERRFFNYRLDHMKEVKLKDYYDMAEKHHTDIMNNLDRLIREGQGGELKRLEENIYLYTKEVFDSGDISPWIKTFTRRIIQLKGTNQFVINRFYKIIKRMKEMYENE